MSAENAEKVMLAIEHHFARYGRPPTIRELQEVCKFKSISQVQRALDMLETDGYILRDKQISRGIRLTAKRMFL